MVQKITKKLEAENNNYSNIEYKPYIHIQTNLSQLIGFSSIRSDFS